VLRRGGGSFARMGGMEMNSVGIGCNLFCTDLSYLALI